MTDNVKNYCMYVYSAFFIMFIHEDMIYIECSLQSNCLVIQQFFNTNLTKCIGKCIVIHCSHTICKPGIFKGCKREDKICLLSAIVCKP